MGWLLSALEWVLGRLLKNPNAPTSGEKLAKEAGAAEAVQTEAVQRANTAVAEAQAAVNAASDRTDVVAELKAGNF
jgi:hypothetical protein